MQLIVTKERGVFTLREIENGVALVTVKAQDPQLVRDYISANWPVGTTARWIIIPASVAPVAWGADPGGPASTRPATATRPTKAML